MPEPYFVIKSYKRAGTVKTIKVVPFADIWVPESQGDDYRKFYGDKVKTIPDGEDGNLCRKQNAILNRTPSDWTVILDDDITSFGYWEDGDHLRMNPDQIYAMAVNMFTIAEDLGIELWGIQQNHDELLYQTFRPFSLLAPVLGPFHGHIRPTLRYDESVLGKDDYDFWLLNIRKFHKTLRANKYHYVCDHGKMKGGFVSMRSMDQEKKAVERMTQKWGPKVFREGGTAGGRSATGENILNSRLTIPIEGC